LLPQIPGAFLAENKVKNGGEITKNNPILIFG
jgi:hypothetical protein